jgi:hypothetical protein
MAPTEATAAPLVGNGMALINTAYDGLRRTDEVIEGADIEIFRLMTFKTLFRKAPDDYHHAIDKHERNAFLGRKG